VWVAGHSRESGNPACRQSFGRTVKWIPPFAGMTCIPSSQGSRTWKQERGFWKSLGFYA
jgi:hypothetical protein